MQDQEELSVFHSLFPHKLALVPGCVLPPTHFPTRFLCHRNTSTQGAAECLVLVFVCFQLEADFWKPKKKKKKKKVGGRLLIVPDCSFAGSPLQAPSLADPSASSAGLAAAAAAPVPEEPSGGPGLRCRTAASGRASDARAERGRLSAKVVTSLRLVGFCSAVGNGVL